MPFKRDLIIATFDPASNQKVLVQIPEATWRKAGKVTPQMAAQLDEVLGNPAYRRRVQVLQRDFLEADDAGRGAETIERLLHIHGRNTDTARKRAGT